VHKNSLDPTLLPQSCTSPSGGEKRGEFPQGLPDKKSEVRGNAAEFAERNYLGLGELRGKIYGNCLLSNLYGQKGRKVFLSKMDRNIPATGKKSPGEGK